jgi:hypothetical protein
METMVPTTTDDFNNLNVRQRLLAFLSHALTEIVQDQNSGLNGFEKMIARDAGKLVLKRVSRYLVTKTDEEITDWLRGSAEINRAFVELLTQPDGASELQEVTNQIKRLRGGPDGENVEFLENPD